MYLDLIFRDWVGFVAYSLYSEQHPCNKEGKEDEADEASGLSRVHFLSCSFTYSEVF